MSTFKFIFLTGGSITFRGLQGDLTLVDPKQGLILKARLDALATTEGKRLTVPIVNGLARETAPSTESYHDVQVFGTAFLQAGYRRVTARGVYDDKGKSIKPRPPMQDEAIGVEIAAKRVGNDPNVWIGWTVANAGKATVTVLGDGRVLKKREIDARPVPLALITKMKSLSDLRFRVHTDVNAKPSTRIVVGDVVACGFTLDEILKVGALELQVRFQRAQRNKSR